MTIHKQLREQLATYRDLSKAERAALKRRLTDDPAGAELLAAYEAMDRRLADLADPRPDPALRRDFYAALQGEGAQGQAGWFGRRLGGVYAAAGQLAAAAALIILVVGAAALFRQQSEFAASGSPVPISTGRPTKAATGTPIGTAAPVRFPAATPTYAVIVPPDAPFAPFHRWASQWPQHTGMTHGALRAGLKTYLLDHGGVEALLDPAVMGELKAALEGHLPAPGAGLQLADVYPGGELELVVAVLPFVDVVGEDEEGVLHITGLGNPEYWPVENTFPTAVQVEDVVAFDGQPEIQVFYSFVDGRHTFQEYLIAKWDPARTYWREVLRAPLLGVEEDVSYVNVDRDRESGNTAVSITCRAVGPWETSLLREDLYVWDGDDFMLWIIGRDEPADQRQYLGLAEARLRSGQIGGAAEMYRALYQGEVTLPAPNEQIDWQVIAAMRAGQLYTLLDQPEEAEAALAQASLRGSPLGQWAGRFSEAYRDADDAAAAWAALVAMKRAEIENDDAIDAGNRYLASFANDTVVPMALAAALQSRDVINPAAPSDLLGIWAEYDLAAEVGQGRVEDLDYDGANEVIVTLPTPGGQAPVWLLDRGEDGWFTTLLGLHHNVNAPLTAPQLGPNGDFQVMAVGDEYVGWNGRYPFYYSEMADWEGNWRLSAQPEHRCYLPADDLFAVAEFDPRDGETAVTPNGPTPGERTPTPTPLSGTP